MGQSSNDFFNDLHMGNLRHSHHTPRRYEDPHIGLGMADLIMQGDHVATKEHMEQQIMKKEGYTGYVMAANIIASAYFKRTYKLQKRLSGETNPQRHP